MSGRELLVMGAFTAVIATLVVALTDLETGAVIVLVAAFAAYSAVVLRGVHRARSRH